MPNTTNFDAILFRATFGSAAQGQEAYANGLLREIQARTSKPDEPPNVTASVEAAMTAAGQPAPSAGDLDFMVRLKAAVINDIDQVRRGCGMLAIEHEASLARMLREVNSPAEPEYKSPEDIWAATRIACRGNTLG